MGWSDRLSRIGPWSIIPLLGHICTIVIVLALLGEFILAWRIILATVGAWLMLASVAAHWNRSESSLPGVEIPVRAPLHHSNRRPSPVPVVVPDDEDSQAGEDEEDEADESE